MPTYGADTIQGPSCIGDDAGVVLSGQWSNKTAGPFSLPYTWGMDTPLTKVDSKGRVWQRGGQPVDWEPGCIGSGGPTIYMDLPGFWYYFLMRCGVEIDENGVYWWYFPPV